MYKRLGYHRTAISLAVVLLFVLFLPWGGNIGVSYAYEAIPDVFRIGLYFNSDNTSNPAVDSVRLYSGAGLELGFADQFGNYVNVYDYKFLNASSTLQLAKYNFSKKYAVAVTGDTPGLAGITWLAAALREKGYEPVTAWINQGWVLLVGSFGGKSEANSFIKSNLKKDFTGAGNAYSAAELTGRYISASADGALQFVYETGSGNLKIRPAAQNGGGTPSSVQSSSIQLNGKAYRGEIELARNERSDMTVVNVLSVNEYLYGVVPRELEASSNPEALKAQAVAARTYAVISSKKHAALGFDLCDTQDCQVYGGVAWEDERSNRAVEETDGKIVTWEGAPAQVFYFSSSGGATEDVKNVWGSEFPYLKGVEDPYESGKSNHYKWETTYSARQIREQLLTNGVDIGAIQSVSVTGRSDAGRAIEVTVKGAKGTKVYQNEACRYFLKELFSQQYTIAGNADARYQTVDASGNQKGVSMNEKTAVSAQGTGKLKGGNASVVIAESGMGSFPMAGDIYRFSGTGWGHAVGMSQEGAKGMADAGFSYEQILRHYFSDCVIE